MLITRTVTKKVLEQIVHETFLNFGNISSSSLLDSLKFLGFYYATNAGVSINIEDLKTPEAKKLFLKKATEEMSFVSTQWEQGFVSDTERFQSIIDSWNIATECLKNRIIDYYQNFDPANNLYIMAFSGARGNMSQVRQLVGMRGLMSDQEGKIIDLPIQTNFREGLSSIDYIISSYGARKGIVDTALKTADSGYLTRRLIYVAQDLVIREINCKTKNGTIILFNESTNVKNILGRFLIDIKDDTFSLSPQLYNNVLLTEKILESLNKFKPLILNIRSPLMCKANGSICQACYGWDLAHNKIISLGEAVGIIAAQSIGEPGTQLTMRTFHTGGIFTSEMLRQTLAPFSGKVEIPFSLKAVAYRTSHGILVSKLLQETTIHITNWEGRSEHIYLEIGSYLYLSSSTFVKKGQLISEYSSRSAIAGTRRLKPIYTSMSGEIRFESLSVRYIPHEDKNRSKVKVNQDDGVLWLASGKIFTLPKEVSFSFPENLKTNRAFASLKIVTPFDGTFFFDENMLWVSSISKGELSIKMDLSAFSKGIKNCKIKLSILPRNYQIVDKQTILGFLNIFPNYNEKVYAARKKDSNFFATYFLITTSDIWKINSDQVNNFSPFNDAKGLKEGLRGLRSGTILNNTSRAGLSGFLLKKDGFKLIFQNALPIFLSKGTILNYKQGDFTPEKHLLATLVNYTQQTEDIVQGLPKIEDLIEARPPKIKSELAKRPGILLSPWLGQKLKSLNIDSVTMSYFYERLNLLDLNVRLIKKGDSLNDYFPKKKQIVELAHSVSNTREILFFGKKAYALIPLPPGFVPMREWNQKTYHFKNHKDDDQPYELSIHVNGQKLSAVWSCEERNSGPMDLFKYHDNKLWKWKTLEENSTVFINKKAEHYIIKTGQEDYFFLESLNPINKYSLQESAKVSLKPGAFVDIGEPLTDGAIDPHDLLSTLFKYHYALDGMLNGSARSLNKFQLILVNSVQSIYQSQGVNISSKHIEIIVRQMTTKVLVIESGDTPFLAGERVQLSLMVEVYKTLYSIAKGKVYKTPKYEPIFRSTTHSSLSKDGFLSSAGFQETKRILTRAAIEGSSDWLRGLKECVIIGRLIPAGSAFLNYKNYLDNIYLFKN